ncbi:MAG: DUF4388 domain-containing protein [Verrucomicrobiota bacterium]
MKGTIKFGEATLADVLQFTHVQNTSGSIRLQDSFSGETGFITISKGDVINCNFAGKKDQDALLEIARRSEVAYELVEDVLESERTITLNLTNLLMDLALELDTTSHIASNDPSLKGRLAINLEDRSNWGDLESFYYQEYEFMAYYGKLIAADLGHSKVRVSAYQENGRMTMFKKNGASNLEVLRSKIAYHKLKEL